LTCNKTDAVDAVMLARLGAMLQPDVRPFVSQAIDDLRELHVARMALVKNRVATLNRSHSLRLPLLKRYADRHLKQIACQVAAIDAAISDPIAADASLARRLDILLSIPGVGKLTAFAILIEMPELGSIENKAAASLAGLAHVEPDSGRKQGKRFIQGGRVKLRHALYMPALVAAWFNPDLKAKYQAFIQAGKPRKLAITAIIRKLLILANALIRNGRTWTPEHP